MRIEVVDAGKPVAATNINVTVKLAPHALERHLALYIATVNQAWNKCDTSTRAIDASIPLQSTVPALRQAFGK